MLMLVSAFSSVTARTSSLQASGTIYSYTQKSPAHQILAIQQQPSIKAWQISYVDDNDNIEETLTEDDDEDDDEMPSFKKFLASVPGYFIYFLATPGLHTAHHTYDNLLNSRSHLSNLPTQIYILYQVFRI